MPQTYETLRRKFMVGDDDGILKAENILQESGWTIDDFLLHPPEVDNVDKHTIGEQIDARDYLLEEWFCTCGERENRMNQSDMQGENIRINGKAWHLMKLAEECNELSGAIMKYFCKGDSEVEILKEAVDVEIALSNLRVIFGAHESIFDMCLESKRARIDQKTQELQRSGGSLGEDMATRIVERMQ